MHRSLLMIQKSTSKNTRDWQNRSSSVTIIDKFGKFPKTLPDNFAKIGPWIVCTVLNVFENNRKMSASRTRLSRNSNTFSPLWQIRIRENPHKEHIQRWVIEWNANGRHTVLIYRTGEREVDSWNASRRLIHQLDPSTDTLGTYGDNYRTPYTFIRGIHLA